MDAEIPRERLVRRCRLRRRVDFVAVQERGRRVAGPCYMVFSMRRAPEDRGSSGSNCTRFGVTVSRKVGHAVVRNRVKRWIRECYRRLAAGASYGANTDLVVVARPSAARASYRATVEELRGLLQRLPRS